MPKYERNTEKNGLEVSFEGIPDDAIRTELKESGFRWHRVNKFWYAKETQERLALVERICGVSGSSQKKTVTQAAAPVSTPVPVARSAKKYVRKTPSVDYALKVKIKDIVSADKAQLEDWEKLLKE